MDVESNLYEDYAFLSSSVVYGKIRFQAPAAHSADNHLSFIRQMHDYPEDTMKKGGTRA